MKRLLLALIILLSAGLAKAIEIPVGVDANIPIGPFTDANAKYLETLSIPYTNIWLTRYGATGQSVKTNTSGLAYLGRGVYNCPLTGATDVNAVGWFRIDVNDINGVPVWSGSIEVVSTAFWNLKYLGTTLTVTEPNFTPTATPTIIVANQTTLKSSMDANGNQVRDANNVITANQTTLKTELDNNSPANALTAWGKTGFSLTDNNDPNSKVIIAAIAALPQNKTGYSLADNNDPNSTAILAAIAALPQNKTGYSLSASQTFSTTGDVGSVSGIKLSDANSVINTAIANISISGGSCDLTTVTAILNEIKATQCYK